MAYPLLPVEPSGYESNTNGAPWCYVMQWWRLGFLLVWCRVDEGVLWSLLHGRAHENFSLPQPLWGTTFSLWICHTSPYKCPSAFVNHYFLWREGVWALFFFTLLSMQNHYMYFWSYILRSFFCADIYIYIFCFGEGSFYFNYFVWQLSLPKQIHHPLKKIMVHILAHLGLILMYLVFDAKYKNNGILTNYLMGFNQVWAFEWSV